MRRLTNSIHNREILTGEFPFHNYKPSELIPVLREGQRPPIPPDVNPAYAELMTSCWHQTPSSREYIPYHSTIYTNAHTHSRRSHIRPGLRCPSLNHARRRPETTGSKHTLTSYWTTTRDSHGAYHPTSRTIIFIFIIATTNNRRRSRFRYPVSSP